MNFEGNRHLDGNRSDEEFIEVTIDSGASESVMSKKQARKVRMRPSEGSRNKVQYIAANGAVIDNEGEKHVKVETAEGYVCNLKMQITAVNKALLSVSKICDTGHDITFWSEGGAIVHRATGQTVKFKRIDGVYRMRLNVLGEGASVFPRPGK